MKHKTFVLLILALLLPATAQAALITREIPYQDGSVPLKGYLVYDDAMTAPAPGILVIHEWWGHNDYVRKRAVQLAQLGYVAFALDMYGEGKLATTPGEATALSKPFYDDRALMRGRAHAGLDVLKSQSQVDKTKLGVIGYCFGGATALEMARGGENVLGVVNFHGNLATPHPTEPGDVHAAVLALNGAEDPFVSPKEKQDFAKEMTNAKVNFKSIDYAGATHAFTNPDATAMGKKFNLPIAYNATADAKSWQEMQLFFRGLFGR